ncbi:MAG: hypothetical protein V2I33_25715, partial [Kangiellaceae bacterium]|nr:hypothetical protein [Kangiellaceae bacterium]
MIGGMVMKTFGTTTPQQRTLSITPIHKPDAMTSVPQRNLEQKFNMLRETSNTPVYKIKRLKTEEIMACRIYRFRRMNLSEQN